LVVDPWLDGRAFNHSWSLVTPTRFRHQDFAHVTHLWISHEHPDNPDHFAPSNVTRIPAEARARITVLYQRTEDRRVAAFCRKLGLAEVVELEARGRHSLGPEFEVQLGRPPNDSDSWLYAHVGGWSVLNLNDCVFRTPSDLRRIRRRVGTVDLLLTQFSTWTGNRRSRQAATDRGAARRLGPGTSFRSPATFGSAMNTTST
jgi:hypothetical protein